MKSGQHNKSKGMKPISRRNNDAGREDEFKIILTGETVTIELNEQTDHGQSHEPRAVAMTIPQLVKFTEECKSVSDQIFDRSEDLTNISMQMAESSFAELWEQEDDDYWKLYIK